MSVIDEKYDSLLAAGLGLGESISDETLLADEVGYTHQYQNGVIYYHPDLGAFEVQGAILGRYIELGAEQSSLGYPVSDEEDYYINESCAGRKNEFSYGTITWTPEDGAIESYANSSTDPAPEDTSTSEEQYSNDPNLSEETSAEENQFSTEPEPVEYPTGYIEQPADNPSEVDTWLSEDYPTRKLTVAQALQIIDHLINDGTSSFQIVGNKVDQKNITTMGSGNGETKRVVRTYRIKPDVINGIQFKYLVSPSSAKVAGIIDNVDPRMIVFLYKLTRWLSETWAPANNCTVTELHHIGIGHGNANHMFDCHNTGRALDLGGISGITSDGNSFTLSILNDWGKKPEVTSNGQTCFRLSESDGLIYYFTKDFYAFSMQHCQDKSQGRDELLETSEAESRMLVSGVPTVSTSICHPDHPDSALRSAHKNHFHVQLSSTGYEANPAL